MKFLLLTSVLMTSVIFDNGFAKDKRLHSHSFIATYRSMSFDALLELPVQEKGELYYISVLALVDTNTLVNDTRGVMGLYNPKVLNGKHSPNPLDDIIHLDEVISPQLDQYKGKVCTIDALYFVPFDMARREGMGSVIRIDRVVPVPKQR